MLSVLVAFRDVDGHRSAVWNLIRGMFERYLPAAEIVVGTDDGIDPFHKTLALNRAAAAATGDVFLLTDADTWVAAPRVLAAAAGIEAAPDVWWRPWQQKIKLAEAPTAKLLAEGWDGTVPKGARVENRNAYWAAPPIMLHRRLWEAVGGMDERFRGWGYEDDAFGNCLRTLYGEPTWISGDAVHLWHPRIGRSGRDLWPGQASADDNLRLASRYRLARTPEAMRRLIAERRA